MTDSDLREKLLAVLEEAMNSELTPTAIYGAFAATTEQVWFWNTLEMMEAIKK